MLILHISSLKICSCNTVPAEKKKESNSLFITENEPTSQKVNITLPYFSPCKRFALPSSVGIKGFVNSIWDSRTDTITHKSTTSLSETASLNTRNSLGFFNVWHNRLLLSLMHWNQFSMFVSQGKEAILTWQLLTQKNPECDLSLLYGKRSPNFPGFVCFSGLFLNKLLFLQQMIRSTLHLVCTAQLPHRGSFSWMGYKPITFILCSFSNLGSLAGRLETPLKKR